MRGLVSLENRVERLLDLLLIIVTTLYTLWIMCSTFRHSNSKISSVHFQVNLEPRNM